MKCVRILAVVSCVLACPDLVLAQQSVDYASVSGRVTDPSGAVVPGAHVSVRHTETNLTSTVETDREVPETSAVPGISLSVGSQRNLSNNFIVDGLSANDDAAGLSGITYGVDAIEQFQVVTSEGQAELGRALGGYVNVTKSGTNVRTGRLMTTSETIGSMPRTRFSDRSCR